MLGLKKKKTTSWPRDAAGRNDARSSPILHDIASSVYVFRTQVNGNRTKLSHEQFFYHHCRGRGFGSRRTAGSGIFAVALRGEDSSD